MIRFWLLLCVSLAVSAASAQDIPEFDMSDTTVVDCDGILYDSGGEDGIYGINEMITFTINSGAPVELTFFEEFCVENGLDSLMIYDGPDTSAPLLAGPLTGTELPGPVTSSGESVTLFFAADPSVAYCGFSIFWNTIPPPPVPPAISVNEMPECGTNSFILEFSSPVECGSFDDNDFVVNADGEINVISAEALDCNNDSTTAALVTLTDGFDFNCNYNVDMELGIRDVCDSLWIFQLQTAFLYDQCPIDVEIISNGLIFCGGGCTDIEAVTDGCFTYLYEWDNGVGDGPGPHTVCSSITETYTVTVTELETGNTTQETIDIEVINALIEGGENFTVCQSEPAFELLGQPEGGTWQGNGIINENTGLFEPDDADAGPNWIFYTFQETCVDSLIIDIEPIDAGIATAACPDTDPFPLQAIPAGGTWTGPHVENDLFFNPEEIGSFLVYYTVNGCTDSLTVNVENLVASFSLDTVCQSVVEDTLGIEPFGGVWSGSGITDNFYGIWNPEEATPGDITLFYDAEGCDQEWEVFVKEINIGNRTQNTCPEELPYELAPGFVPTGGYWEGTAIIDDINGVFDPSIPPNDSWHDLLYHAPNGCTDTISMYVRQTEILNDTMFFCEGAMDPVFLDFDGVGRTPWGGSWAGDGIHPNADQPWRLMFYPDSVPIGAHTLVYNANTCLDSIVMVVHPPQPFAGDYALCSSEGAFFIDPQMPPGGTWTGTGVTDPASGWFDPDVSGQGIFDISWVSPAGCSGQVEVIVETFEQATVSGLEAIYCYENQTFSLTFEPDDGSITGPADFDGFNPATAGEGQHTIHYEWQGDYCFSETEVETFVYPAIQGELTVTDSLICPGQGVTLNVSGEGGEPGSDLVIEWNNGLISLDQHNVAPESNTWYVATLNDDCSDEWSDSVFVEVLAPLSAEILTSDTLCFGDEGFAQATPLPEGNQYEVQWEGLPGTEIFGPAGGSYNLFVADTLEGCTFDTLVFIPAYPPITALFSSNPEADCIPFESNPVSFIDLSQNAVDGFWVFNETDTVPYTGAGNPEREFAPGEYFIELQVENIGGCTDYFAEEICVLDPAKLFVPDIFSPNDDGVNDRLFVRGRGIENLEFHVYDRWGQRVFSSDHPDHSWDGRFRGQRAPSGVYVWQLRALLNDGSTEKRQGNVTLIR